VRPRLPSLRPFSVGTGLFAGVCAGLLAHHLAPGITIPDVGLAPAVGFLTLLGVWVALEQVPAVVDRLLLGRGHYALGVLALCPALAVLLVDATDVAARSEGARLQAVAVTLVGLLATAAATSQRARLLCERETVELVVEAVETQWRRLAVTAASFVVCYAGFAAVYPAVFSVASFVGGALGLGIGSLVVGEQRVDLTVLDRGLLVGGSGRLGASRVPWSRVRHVTVDGDTLTVSRGLPWPLVYRVDLGEVEDRATVVEALRSRVDGR
jgi:hypothetical protein